MTRLLLGDDHTTERVQRKMADFHEDTVAEVRQTVERAAVVVVGMAQNPIVKRAKKALNGAGVDFTYLEYGSYLSQWKRRLAIKMWSGWPTFPQVFVRGTLLGGNHELKKMLDDGSLRVMLDEEG